RGWRADPGPRARDGLPGCDRVLQNRSPLQRTEPAPSSFREQVQPAEPPIHPSAELAAASILFLPPAFQVFRVRSAFAADKSASSALAQASAPPASPRV